MLNWRCFDCWPICAGWRLECAAMFDSIAFNKAYTRAQLLQTRGGPCCQLSPVTIDSVRSLGLVRRRRGTRAGCNKQRPIHIVARRSRDFDSSGKQTLFSMRPADRTKLVSYETSIIVTSPPVLMPRSDPSSHRPRSSLLRVHVDRHAGSHNKP